MSVKKLADLICFVSEIVLCVLIVCIQFGACNNGIVEYACLVVLFICTIASVYILLRMGRLLRKSDRKWLLTVIVLNALLLVAYAVFPS